MKVFQRIKSLLFRRKPVSQITHPNQPGFDIGAWLDEGIRLRKQNPDQVFVCFPTAEGLREGITDHDPAPEASDKEHESEIELTKAS